MLSLAGGRELLLALAQASAATCAALGGEEALVVLLEKVLRKGPVSQAAFKAIALAGDAKAAEFTPRLRPRI